MQTRTLEYKILCEVHLLHDYFLIDHNNTSFFAKEVAQRQVLLERKLQTGAYDMSRWFEFLMDQSNLEILSNYKLRFMPTALGFAIAMEVKSEPQSDGSVLYRPAITPPKDLTLSIGLNPINRLFANVSSVALGSTDQKIYQFTNQRETAENVLSVPVPAYTSNRIYQMGDLALLNGKIQQALDRLQGDVVKWAPVSGIGFVNDADRILDTNTNWFKTWKLGFSRPIPQPFGMIQLQLLTDNPNNSLLTSDGFLTTRRPPGLYRAVPKKFELRFLSRFSYWRYGKKEGFTEEEINTVNQQLSGFFEWQGNRFVSIKPRYFTQTLTKDESPRKLPNAQPEFLRAEAGRWYSDISFNEVNAFPKSS
jgi:hypothetical protein